jgi:pimeloyl-ACP methyl ester carboxylesterase
MPEICRTPDERFVGLPDYPFAPHFLEWEGLRMHYLDEGGDERPVLLMLHGMPTWSFLYRRMVPPLVEAGYRCVAPDHIGFGRSDKVLDDTWYSIERHSRGCAHLIGALDLRGITLVCQDWGGPIGLRQAVDMSERFERLVLMNTWLHCPEHSYSDAIRSWNSLWHEGGAMDQLQGCGLVMQHFLTSFPTGSTPLTPEQAFAAYEAPFPDRASKAGPRRFPLSLPFDNPEGGNAALQERRGVGTPLGLALGAGDVRRRGGGSLPAGDARPRDRRDPAAPHRRGVRDLSGSRSRSRPTPWGARSAFRPARA